MKKKVVLIALPSPFEEEPAMNPPLGLAYIAASALKGRHNIAKVVDFATIDCGQTLTSKQLGEIYLYAEIYGISVLSSQVHWLKQVVAYIRKYNKNCLIVMGGPHATNCPEECLRMGADYVIRGEGEVAFRSFLDDKPIRQHPGICFLENNILVDNGRTFLDNINNAPLPARHLFDMSKYKREVQGLKAAHIITIRGCPYNCAYCDKKTVNNKVRFRTPASVFAEVDNLIKEFGIKALVIYDDIFTLDRDRALQLCRGFFVRKLRWRCWSRADKLDEDLLKAMKASGMTSITLGIESGDDAVLKAMRKKLTAETNKQALLLCKKLRVPVRCSLIYGGPGENRQSLERTIKLVQDTQPDEWNLAIMSPIPGSDIWDKPTKYGYLLNHGEVRRSNYIHTNRFGDSGVGSIYAWPVRGSKQEYKDNLEFFVSELERVCPRKKIQDTIQTIDVTKV